MVGGTVLVPVKGGGVLGGGEVSSTIPLPQGMPGDAPVIPRARRRPAPAGKQNLDHLLKQFEREQVERSRSRGRIARARGWSFLPELGVGAGSSNMDIGNAEVDDWLRAWAGVRAGLHPASRREYSEEEEDPFAEHRSWHHFTRLRGTAWTPYVGAGLSYLELSARKGGLTDSDATVGLYGKVGVGFSGYWELASGRHIHKDLFLLEVRAHVSPDLDLFNGHLNPSGIEFVMSVDAAVLLAAFVGFLSHARY